VIHWLVPMGSAVMPSSEAAVCQQPDLHLHPSLPQPLQ
jgi:hypothetical protein